jgi:hypothetical protein
MKLLQIFLLSLGLVGTLTCASAVLLIAHHYFEWVKGLV